MTPRSHKFHSHPRTTAISPSIRDRVEQNLSEHLQTVLSSQAQPSLGAHRAAALPRHHPVNIQTPQSHPNPSAWSSPDSFPLSTNSPASHFEILEESPLRHYSLTHQVVSPIANQFVQSDWNFHSAIEESHPQQSQAALSSELACFPSTLVSSPESDHIARSARLNPAPPQHIFSALRDMR